MRMKKIWAGMISLIVFTAVVQAGTIVKWGESGGDTNIVTGGAAGQNTMSATYGNIVSPADGVKDYDLSAAGQTRTFYGAQSLSGASIVNNGGPSADHIQLVHNLGGFAGSLTNMVAWESQDFLTTDSELESMSVSFSSRGGDDTDAYFLIETSAGWYVSDAFATNITSSTYIAYSKNVGELSWSGFSEFGVTNGTIAAATADTNDIQSVGVYYTSTENTGTTWIGSKTAYFEVMATGGGNQPPVADAQSVDVVQNSFVDITLTGSDSEGSNLTYSVSDTTTHGVLTGATNQWTYTPVEDYTGPDSFTFTVNDGDTNSTPATVSISVNLQDPPVADAQNVNVEKNTFVDITLTGSDPEGSNLTYSVTDTLTHGVLTGATNKWIYTPDTNYTGPDSFTFTVNDGETNSEPATVSIEVFTPISLYYEDFSTDPGYTNDNTTSIGSNTNGAGTYFTFGEYNGSHEIGVTTDTGVLHIDSNTTGGGGRTRGLSVFIDTSAASPGNYTVSFNVTNWLAGFGTVGFKVHEGSGLHSEYIQLDNGDGNDGGNSPGFGGTANSTLLESTWGTGTKGTGISTNGLVSLEVTLTKAGQAGNYLALAWTQVRSGGDDLAPKFDVDNVFVGKGTPAPPIEGTLYSAWALSYNLTGDDALEGSDVEPDGLDNLMEYALGGNPTNDDAAAVSPETYTADESGTNWFYHVHNQNTDTDLTFTVGATPDLVGTPADTNDVSFVGESAVLDDFKSVTNRTEATTDAKFIKLDVSK
jgi:hypothetical protein